MTYRPEIDGLRAIAVLAVIFAHANFTVFGGGFVGVDVFFVISGYLITSIILGEYERGEFSLVRFYERRARRILPALFFVLACTIPFAWMWLLSDAYEQFSKSLMMATLSVSNIYFLKKTDYFAPDASEVPLLHTWSLGVEEQFYVLFPLLFLFRLKSKTIFRIVLAIALVSLIASEFGARHFHSTNYYLLPTRAWEILAGSLCAFYVSCRGQRANGGLALLGLSMVVLSIFAFDQSTRIPSIAASLPVGGAMLFLVFASRETTAGRLLSSSLLVWIGRISFSAYLWHQPIFAFWRIRSPEPPSTLVMCGLIVVTLLLAALSWRLMEQPFRHRKADIRRIVSTVSACVIGLVGFGAWGDIGEGLPFRLAPGVKNFIDRTTWSGICLFQVRDGLPTLPDEKCMFNLGTGKTYALWGDSVAAALSPALLDELKTRNIGMVQLTHGFCAPIMGVSNSRADGSENCDAFNKRAMDYLVASDIDTVIMAASWVNFFNGRYMQINDKELSGAGITISDMAANLRNTIGRLEAIGKRVLVVYPSPRFKKPVMDVMAARIVKGDMEPDFEYSYADFKANTGRAYSVLDLGLPPDVQKVLPEAIFCNPPSSAPCFFGRDGVAYIADNSHYTQVGGQMIVERIMKAMGSDENRTSMVLRAN